MICFFQIMTTFLQVPYPTRFRSAFFTPPYKHHFGLYEHSYHPPPIRPARTPNGPPPPCLPPQPPSPGPTARHLTPPPGPPNRPATPPSHPALAASRSSAPVPKRRVARSPGDVGPVPTRRAARRLEPANVGVCVRSISKRRGGGPGVEAALQLSHRPECSGVGAALRLSGCVGAALRRRECCVGAALRRRGGGVGTASRRRRDGVGATLRRHGGCLEPVEAARMHFVKNTSEPDQLQYCNNVVRLQQSRR